MTQQEILDKLTADIRLRGMSKDTVKEYTTKARLFMQHFGKSADEMGEKEFRAYLEFLDNRGNLTPASINTYNSALRFLFEVTLEQNLNYKRLPRKKDPIKLPNAMTRQEILWFLNAIDDDIRYKAVFSLLYGCGLRLSEVAKLHIKDIDSDQMRLFVDQGKGQRDRYVPLPQTALFTLREYFKQWRPDHPDGYLFLNPKGDNHISDRAIQNLALIISHFALKSK